MNKSIRKKLILYIIPIVSIVLTLTFHISMTNSRTIIQQEIYHTIDAKQDEQSKAIQDALSKIEGTSDIFASSVGSTYKYLNADIYNNILTNMLIQDSNLRSAGVWFEPYTGNNNQKYERYFVENLDNNVVVYDDYYSSSFDYLNNELYINCKNTRKSSFSDAHYHELTGTYTITYISPIIDFDGQFIGCISSSFDITQLKTLVDKYSDDVMDFYIIDSNGVYIGHKDLDLVKSRSNILDCSEDFEEDAKTILSTESGTLTHVKNDETYYIHYETVSDFGWKIIYEIPDDYIRQPLIKLTTVNTIVCILAITILICLILYVSNKFVYEPLELLSGEFKNISNNKYDSDIPKKLLSTGTEFSDIGKSLNEMKLSLSDYQNKLELNNNLLIENEKSLKNTVEYVNTIIGALPIMMFIFDRDGICVDLHGMTPFSNRPKNFYKGKHYIDLLGSDIDQCLGLEEFLNVIKTIEHNDGVIHVEISPLVNGKREYFEHSLSLGPDNRVISLCRQTTDTVNHIQDMKYLSDFDELTGLYNSRYFIDMIKKHVVHTSLPISIIVCDVNGLKAINDKYGFEEGDEVLLDLTVVLNNIKVENKTVSRVAGDEFAVILPNTTKAEAESIIENINNLCVQNKVGRIPFSIGYGVDTATSGDESLLHLIKSVEELLYKQKVYTSSGKKDNSIGLINSIFHAKNKREQLHSERVSDICLEMAKALGWSQLDQRKISTAGLLHDIGKIGISEALLNKTDKLTDEEYAEMCTHPEIGFRILQSFDNMKELSEYAYSHHEKWDGTGYPRQLKGTEIPIEARILAIADTYDAITSARSYREGQSKEFAITELIKCKNTQFDPDLVDVFIEKVLNENLENYQV